MLATIEATIRPEDGWVLCIPSAYTWGVVTTDDPALLGYAATGADGDRPADALRGHPVLPTQQMSREFLRSGAIWVRIRPGAVAAGHAVVLQISGG